MTISTSVTTSSTSTATGGTTAPGATTPSRTSRPTRSADQAPTGPGSRARWLDRHRRRIAVVDTLVVVAAVLLAQWLDLGVDDARRIDGDQRTIYLAMSAAIAALWLLTLHLVHSRANHHLGAGPEEYTGVLRATVIVFGILTVLDVALRVEEFRGYLFVAAPVGTALLLLGRWLQRRYLGHRRLAGKDVYKVLLVGRPESARDLIATLHRDPSAGHVAVGLCVPANQHNDRLSHQDSVTVDGQEIPVLGTWHQIEDAVHASGACTVSVMSSESLGPDAMRELSWRLDRLGVDLVVAPNLLDVDTMRVTTRPVSGLPLLHIEGPRFARANRFTKAAFDRVGAALLILAFAPVLLACALAVKLTSRGPLIYTAPRVGLDGEHFPMYKFRSMVPGAHAMVPELTEAQNAGNEVLFKIKDDPRVTPVGRVMRRYSLDELPQLFNVLFGHMSLVGPRPHLEGEVSQYSDQAVRRLYVRPGMTGLWQVSGRSDLSWDESVRLDLSYVENWSLGLDIIILWRTFRAVLGSDGAY